MQASVIYNMEEFRIVLADACKIVKESSRKRVISGADEDGRVMVEFSEPVGGRRVKMLTPDEINGMLYKEETPESPANAEEAMAEETEPPTAGQEESGESALERIPKDEEGNPQYTQTDAPTAWDAIVEQTEGDEDMARSVVDSTVRDKEAALKKLESSNPKPGATVAEKIAAAKEHKAAIEAARQELEQWKAIAEVENSRKAEVEAKVKAAEEEAKARAKAEEERRKKFSANMGSRYSLSDEYANNGEAFVKNEKGSTNLIEIPHEIFDRLGISPLPFKLTESMALHVYSHHAKELKLKTLDDAIDFVLSTIGNADHVRLGRDNSYVFSVENGKDRVGKRAITIVIGDNAGEFIGIRTSGYESIKKLKERPLLWERSAKAASEDVATPTITTIESLNDDETSSRTKSQSNGSSASKVSESSETKQEKAEKSISAKVKEASADVNTEPTEAQKEAGNYKKGHVQVGAFDITIEQPEGSIRRGTDANGKQWESKMHNTYGYFRGTEGVDGDHIDVFLSNDMDGWNGAQVFVVDQYNPDGTFDEHKVMLGFNDASDAKNNYLANYKKGWENGRRIDVSAVSLADFEKWIASSHRKTKPFSEYKSVKPTDDSETFKGPKVENSGKDIEAQIKHLEEIKDYPGADKKIVQSEIDRLKAKEEATAKSKSEEVKSKSKEVKSKSKEENGVDDAKIDAVLEALSKGDEKAEQLVQGLTSRELSKLRSKVKASPVLENEWQWRAQNRGDVSLHDWMLENQYVGKDSRLLSILQVKDEKKPNDELYRVGGSKELRDGRKIEFVRKPTATYNALARHLQAEGIKPDMHEARTGSRYMSFEKDGVQWEVRSSDHTKPEYYGEAQKPVELTYYKDKQGEENLSVSVDLGTSGYNIEDMKALMAEIDRLKNDAGEVKESFYRGVASDEVMERYPLLSRALGVKPENEVRAKEEAREHAEEARKHAEEARKQEMRSAVEDMAGKLHLNNVDIVDKPAGRGAGRRERAKGMFERSTGRITINIGNCADKRDAVVTLLYEAVAHHGLRKLFGENFETFLDNVYNSANAEIRRIIDKHSRRYGGDKRTATEEYMASLAERTDFENAKKSGWWQRIKDFFLKMLEKIGLKGFKGEDLSDNELRYVLWRSYENLKSGGKDTVFSAADDLAKQSELNVGEFAPDAKKTAPEENAEEVNERFNNELQQQIDGNLPDSHIYQMGKPGQILRSTGVPNLPIQMNAKRLQDKATLFDHNFELYEVKDLVKALQNPLAVFSYGDKTKAQNIIVPLQKDGKNFIVGLSLNPTVGGKVLEINSIRNVFPKDNSEWLNWISQGKALYLDKEKIQTLIAQQRTNLADVEYLDLDSAAKVVENFENPKSESKNDALFRDGDTKDYEKAQARETYERRVSTGMFQSREAIQDSMLSLKVAMDAIEEATAGKAKRIEDYDGFENAYLGENRLSSANQAESAAFAHLLIRPMMEEVNRLAPTAKDRAELIDYMFAKHGLERNAYMRQQAAEKKLAEYKKQNPGTAKTAADFIDAERDYAGLTTLTGEADVSAAEAEAQRMVADYENDYTFHGTWNEIYVCRKKIC